MVMKETWSWKRFWMLVAMAAATLAMTWMVLLPQGISYGRCLLFSICGLFFSIFLGLRLEWQRYIMGVYHEKSNNFIRIAMAYGLCCLGTVAVSFCPPFARPILLVGVVMTLASESFTGVLTGCYSALLLSVGQEGELILFACYLLLVVSGCILVQFLQIGGNALWVNWMILGGTLSLNLVCATLIYQKFSLPVLVESLVAGVVAAWIVPLLFRFWNDRIETSKARRLAEILQEKYPLVQAMADFSMTDYKHARRVSRLAESCAELLEADPLLAKTAGFYYRVGRLEGEPYVANGLEIGRRHGFPPELIQILGEYNGQEHLPSTVESAVVHIVDQVVSKFEVLDPATLSSSWNQDIIVYQTLNENSAKGLYDKSGLSMNMFVQVREYLIKEVGENDDNSGK